MPRVHSTDDNIIAPTQFASKYMQHNYWFIMQSERGNITQLNYAPGKLSLPLMGAYQFGWESNSRPSRK